MVLEFPFNRRNRRRSTKSNNVADVLLNAVRQSAVTPNPRRKARQGQLAGTALRIQMLEERLLLAANLSLSAWPGVPYLLEASPNGSDTELILKNRTTNATLDSVIVNSSDALVTITGSAASEDLHINLNGVYTFSGGSVTERIPVALSVLGGGGQDSVTFSGNTAVTNSLSVTAQTIVVNTGVRVDATGAVSFSSVADTGVSSVSTGTNSAAITIGGHVSGASVAMTARTDGQVSTTTSGLGLSAANTWTDSATITVNGGATIEATGNVTLLANRTTEYSATGRSAVNTITGDTSIAIGSATTGSTISSGGDLSIRAVV